MHHNAKVLPISALQPIACPENPPYYRQADQEKSQSHRQAHGHAHIRLAVEAPAKAADQIGVSSFDLARDRLPVKGTRKALRKNILDFAFYRQAGLV